MPGSLLLQHLSRQAKNFQMLFKVILLKPLW
jgi:hypothetical protein